MPNQPLVFLDTETDGLGSNRRVWEVALIRYDNPNTPPVERTFFVDGIEPNRAERGALEIGGYYDRHPHGKRLTEPALENTPPHRLTPVVLWDRVLTRSQAAHDVFRLTRGATLVGVNPAFDAHALERLLNSQGLAPEWDYRLIDMPCIALGALTNDGEQIDLPWSSEELSKWCGVEPPADDERHTALGDARWAMRWYFTSVARRETPA